MSADGALQHWGRFLLGEPCMHSAVVLGGLVELTQLGDHFLDLVKISPHLRGEGIEILSVDGIIIIRILNHCSHISVPLLQFRDCEKALRVTLGTMAVVVTPGVLHTERLILVIFMKRQITGVKLPRVV